MHPSQRCPLHSLQRLAYTTGHSARVHAPRNRPRVQSRRSDHCHPSPNGRPPVQKRPDVEDVQITGSDAPDHRLSGLMNAAVSWPIPGGAQWATDWPYAWVPSPRAIPPTPLLDRRIGGLHPCCNLQRKWQQGVDRIRWPLGSCRAEFSYAPAMKLLQTATCRKFKSLYTPMT